VGSGVRDDGQAENGMLFGLRKNLVTLGTDREQEFSLTEFGKFCPQGTELFAVERLEDLVPRVIPMKITTAEPAVSQRTVAFAAADREATKASSTDLTPRRKARALALYMHM